MKNMDKVWVIGANGQLGSAINELLDRREVEVLNTDLEEVDVTEAESVLNFGEMNRPDVIINCAGLTSVTECENNVEKAYKVNAVGARNVSIVARRIGAKLIHLSTDDVFDGKSQTPYGEFDSPVPCSVYGKSKLAGEQFVKDFAERYFIIRSNWIYGKGNNFIKKLLELAGQKEVINVSKESFGSPTSAKELARFIVYLMESSEYGVYHATCEGTCSRYEFAEEVIKLVGLSVKLEAVHNEEDELAEQRPAYTVLDNLMLRLLGNYQLPHWKEALADYMHTLKK